MTKAATNAQVHLRQELAAALEQLRESREVLAEVRRTEARLREEKKQETARVQALTAALALAARERGN